MGSVLVTKSFQKSHQQVDNERGIGRVADLGNVSSGSAGVRGEPANGLYACLG